MSMARVVITAVVLEGRSKSEVARDYGLSRRWVQTLVARYEAEGEAAFEPRSRRPHSNPRRIAHDVEDAIVALRKQLAEAGHDAGAETIAWHLQSRARPAPSVATIWRVLPAAASSPRSHTSDPDRPGSGSRPTCPTKCWQADITHWPLADGTEAEILNIIDDHSRLLVGSTARTMFKAADIVTDLHAAMTRHGRPERMLTDNGAVFTGHYRGHGWVALERELVALGIKLTHSRPYHPQTCGKVERLHQTLKNWLTRQPAAATIAELQTQLDTFADYYNHQRPTAPSTAAPPPTPGPPGREPSPPDKASDQRTLPRPQRPRRPDGKLTLRHASRLHHIGIGRAGPAPRPHAHPRTQHPHHHRRHRRTHPRPHPRPHPRLPTTTPQE